MSLSGMEYVHLWCGTGKWCFCVADLVVTTIHGELPFWFEQFLIKFYNSRVMYCILSGVNGLEEEAKFQSRDTTSRKLVGKIMVC